MFLCLPPPHPQLCVGDTSFIVTHSPPHLLFIRVRLRSNSSMYEFADLQTELHGHEDGSVPATFQVIYVVSSIFVAHNAL